MEPGGTAGRPPAGGSVVPAREAMRSSSIGSPDHSINPASRRMRGPRTDRIGCLFAAAPVATTRASASSSDRPHVAVSLPLGDGLAECLDLPAPRRHVVVAEALVEGLAQDSVRFKRNEGTLERTGQLPHVAAGIRVSDDRLGRRELPLDAIYYGRGDGRDCEVWIGVGPGPAALEAAQLGGVRAHDGPTGTAAGVPPPGRVDRR